MKKLIKLAEGQATIVENPWTVVREIQVEDFVTLGRSPKLLPLFLWLQAWSTLTDDQARQQIAPWISADDDFEQSIDQLVLAPLIAIDFPSFRDGRGYSVAYLLRKRYGYRRELRAIGDVLRDQLKHMRHCGFDAFDVRADKDIVDALKGLKDFSVRYQPSVIESLPLFRRR